jgi:hypothetical protein
LEGEVFLGNFDSTTVPKVEHRYRSLRRGQTAYGESGSPCPHSANESYRLFPVFVATTEFRNVIMDCLFGSDGGDSEIPLLII